MQAARRVDDGDVAQVVDRVANAPLRNFDGVFAVHAFAVHAHVDLAAERFQLVGRSGTVHVARHEQRIVAFVFQQICQLRSSRRLARALQAHEHDDVRVLGRRKLQTRVLGTEQHRELVEHDLHDVLRWRERFQNIGFHASRARPRDERLHHLEADVGLEQRHAHTTHGCADVAFGQAALAPEIVEYLL